MAEWDVQREAILKMLDKLVTLPENEVPEWYKKEIDTNKLVQYNAVPPNWKQITEEEFAASKFFVYGFSHTEYRQPIDRKTKEYIGSVKLFYICGRPEGVALQSVYENGKYQLKYYSFAKCVHTWREVNRAGMEELAKQFPKLQGQGTWGNCCHNSVCTKCGDYWFTDSSD